MRDKNLFDRDLGNPLENIVLTEMTMEKDLETFRRNYIMR